MQVGNISASFTRPADTTAYAQNDLIANSVTAGSVVPLTFNLANSFPVGQFRLTRIRMFKSGTGVTGATFRLHLYENPPVCTNGDNGAWLTDNSAHWLGNVDIPSMLAFSDGAAGTGSAVAGSELMIRQFNRQPLYGLLMLNSATAYTPASAEKFTLVLETLESY